MKSKKKKDDPGTPAKTALSSEYDAESGLAANPDKESSAGGLSRSSSKKSSKLKKSKNAAGAPSRRRFSIRNWIFNNPIFPPPFGNSGGRTTVTERYTPTATTTAGPSGSSRNTSRKSENSVPDSSWRDNVSSYSQGQAEGALLECPLCMGHYTSDQFPMLRNCPHQFCMECLHTYTKLEIQEGRVNLKCPQCTELIHPNDIALLLGEKYSHLLNLYESLMLRRILATDPDTRWCPRPNCTYAVIAAGCASCPRIECKHPGCGYAFCYHCKAEWHPDQTCDAARAQRNQQIFGSSSAFSLESGAVPTASTNSGPMGITSNAGIFSEVKACPRCQVLAVKNHDGSCNHMTCAVCGVEFCWLCMKEISDLHYLSPSGCTFWGKKPWSRKKKLLWQLGTLIGAPVGIALLAGISIPAMLIGIPSWVGRKIHDHYKGTNKHKRNIAVLSGVVGSVIVSPVLAGLAVSIGVPILLCYVYGVVPIALCRSEGCGVTTSSSGVKIDIDEEQDPPYRPPIVANPSIGEVSLGASLSMGSGCILENNGDNASREPDRESASVTAVAGASLTGSVASSYLGPIKAKNNRLEVGVDVHPRKKFSFSSERLSETVSLSERSATVSFSEEAERNSVAASTRALAGSLLAYRMGDSQSVHSYRTVENPDCQSMAAIDDGVSLRSLPLTQHHHSAIHSNQGTMGQMGHLNPPRSMSPVSSMSGDELSHGGRRSQRRRPLLDKQLSENSSLLSAEDTTSERVRFDDNISFIDDTTEDQVMNTNADNTSLSGRLLKGTKPSILPEETAEELAEVISPELKPKKDFKGNPILKASTSTAAVTSATATASRLTIDEAGSSILSQGASGVTLLSVGGQQTEDGEEVEEEEETLKESFSAKL